MKKAIAAVMTTIMVISLAGCGGGQPAGSASTSAAQTKAETSAPAETGDKNSVSASLSLGTGDPSGTYYAYGGVLANYIASKTEINTNVVSTAGTIANLTGIDDGTYDFATVQSDVMTYAYNGINSFEESGPNTSFRTLGALYPDAVQMITCDPEVKSVSDLAGKSVCVGNVGSGTYYTAIDVLAAYDLTLDDINPVYQSYGDSAENLKDGKISAAFVVAAAPNTAVTDLSTSKTVYLIPIDDEHMGKLIESGPWYAPLTIPASVYKGFDEEVNTICVKCTLVCRADLDDDVAYAIVSTIFDNKKEIAALHAKGEELSLEFATENIAVPFAKGAAKYYEEKGITVEIAE
ncbi:MAG: TAXI family TRAP transporter solute-binding subunit [Eubacteriales bacterium]|nr:TAXI family TRAP transporter solute-binding subunit [Eubacteriales bacterium]